MAVRRSGTTEPGERSRYGAPWRPARAEEAYVVTAVAGQVRRVIEDAEARASPWPVETFGWPRRDLVAAPGAAQVDDLGMSSVPAARRIAADAGISPVDPKQSFPELEERVLERWREGDVFARQLAPARGRAALELLRGPADRQRQARLPPRPRARLQGHLPALPGDARPPRAAQGRLGLPRAAGRARGREGARASPRRSEIEEFGIAEFNAALPRVGLPLRRATGTG